MKEINIEICKISTMLRVQLKGSSTYGSLGACRLNLKRPTMNKFAPLLKVVSRARTFDARCVRSHANREHWSKPLIEEGSCPERHHLSAGGRPLVYYFTLPSINWDLEPAANLFVYSIPGNGCSALHVITMKSDEKILILICCEKFMVTHSRMNIW